MPAREALGVGLVIAIVGGVVSGFGVEVGVELGVGLGVEFGFGLGFGWEAVFFTVIVTGDAWALRPEASVAIAPIVWEPLLTWVVSQGYS